MSLTLLTLAMILTAYLAGSISSAVLVCRLRGLPDPRSQGSGNPGATNVLRIGGASAAAMVLLFDMLKGAVPAYVAFRLGVDAVSLGVIAIAACLGHIFPIFFKFKGGKGVATAFGAMAPIGADLSLALIATWVIVVLICRYSSLAAIVTALLAPAYTWYFDERFTVPVAMLSLLIIIRHKENIHRLLKGEESKVSRKKRTDGN
ncbi:glycerol-3-phosphate 1-O-acyltransferase PlsY [Shewanella loihica]|uniref:Glycerol-3-phosphate acyltransferase n=1 Tax=Shewanella loihica (strain ATCC BAA-1088 / PV-4) TaxID=323850 RepID=PLSY_SHELP|nr:MULTISPECIES: glycerol-3-phosphate 1-O-acyltransferase PlsY [Shewanella]A3QBM4.1 RecName: Full=Glycerol-3-phosphate acyltransferase; AltName: Full=Acyl-PO4 G3P acyltransferase; AltName: Full=Acyl-phosphate--glycerol-3-phosphate acyltransferase; AltName: Full=G3P acyltransferase; Short=GPAT; AltName: Full=Lysophosphatidic acid synthase; Short=LPA synthase [Shewanella loihica PV-4]ABO22872.1 acyl-phosphate glycerol-3-phosphate acyltransferase [Shewanella loihica PV-4]QYJ83386.1 glycerol-3-phosp